MTWKNGLKGNQVYENVVSSLDLFPTFLEAAGADFHKEKQLDGTSLLPYVKAKNKGKPNNLLFWRSVGGFEYAVRKGDFKLYKSAYKGKTLLFNIKKDPIERYDIADKNQTIVADLEKEYKLWDAKNLAPGWVDPHAEHVIQEEKDLQSLRNRSLRKTK